MKLLTATLLISLGFIALSQTKASNRLAQKTLKSLIQSRSYARQEEGEAEGEVLPENDQGDNYDWSYDNSTAPAWEDYNNTGGDYDFFGYNNETSGDNNWTLPYDYSDYGNYSDYDYGYGGYDYGNYSDSGDYSYDDGSNSGENYDWSGDDSSGDYELQDDSNGEDSTEGAAEEEPSDE